MVILICMGNSALGNGNPFFRKMGYVHNVPVNGVVYRVLFYYYCYYRRNGAGVFNLLQLDSTGQKKTKPRLI